MGSDNLFKKRKIAEQRDFARAEANKDEYTSIAIICEGEKSEPQYFYQLIDDLNLNHKLVTVRQCNSGNDPRNIVQDGLDTYKKHSDTLDEVYCVFDRDGHNNFDEAVQMCQDNAKNDIPITAILSYPCFEYWVLMHFSCSTKSLPKCDDVIAELKKKCLRKYEKKDSKLYSNIKSRTDVAIANAKSTYKQAKEIDDMNPSSNIYMLIERLQDIAKTQTL